MASFRMFRRSSSRVSDNSQSFRITGEGRIIEGDGDLELGALSTDLSKAESDAEMETERSFVSVDLDHVEKDNTPPPPPPSNSQEAPKSIVKKSDPVELKSRVDVILHQQNWLEMYKILMVLSIVSNLLCLILAAVGKLPSAKRNAATISIANIVAVVLSRSEVFLRCVFWFAVKVFGHKWIPVILKTTITSILQSVGGIHSGCGLSAVFWLIYAIVNAFEDRKANPVLVLSLAIAILVIVILSILAACPILRHNHHNVFERTHRIAGWTSLGLLWAFIILTDSYDPATKSYSVGSSLKTEVQLWFTVGVTIIIILPWICVSKVALNTVVSPFKNNSLLHFEGGVQPGLLARISRSPLSEWHAFGIISDGKTHTVLAGAVGDFTKGLVERPPTDIWVRRFHFAGLPYLTNMYNKVLHVATGSGICVFLSFLLQETKADVHIIWISKNLPQSYGESFYELLKSIPEDRLTVFDTAVTGRPQTVEVVVNKVVDWGAECVIVTSNPTGSNEIVGGCRAAGIPAFGPIWDS